MYLLSRDLIKLKHFNWKLFLYHSNIDEKYGLFAHVNNLKIVATLSITNTQEKVADMLLFPVEQLVDSF